MTTVAKKRTEARIGEQLYYNLTDEHRQGHDKEWKIGTVTDVKRLYLTINNAHQFSIERGFSRSAGGFTTPGRAFGYEDLILWLLRSDLRKLAATVETCDDFKTVMSIAAIMGFNLKLPNLPI